VPITVPIVGTATATVFYLLRVYSRQLVVHGIGIEDALMGLGLLFTYGVAICIVYGESQVSSRLQGSWTDHTPSARRISGPGHWPDNLGLAWRAANAHCTSKSFP
jgi:hypothetical protein